MINVGEKIEKLRKEKGLSRPVFCGDESELSIRHLARIEKGESQPTIGMMMFIADRLGLPSYMLLPDYYELPTRYSELKYSILRIPIYENDDIFEEKNIYFDEIFDNFYNDLPAEEQLFTDTIYATIEVVRNKTVGFADSILNRHLEDLFNQQVWTINEISIIRLYFSKLFVNREKLDILNRKKLIYFSEFLALQIPFVPVNELFILRDTIIAGISCFGNITECPNFEKQLIALKEIMSITQDFQKKPLVLMLEWKYQLFQLKNYEQAEKSYQQSKAFADIVEDRALKMNLDNEWEEDLKNFLD